ncbi:MAG: ubiquinone/menaquinone biosynthesis methyltransferase [Gemmatimonadaceae bacterium]
MRPDHTPASSTPTAAKVLDAMDVDEHLRDPDRKQAFVTPMFDVIAPRYDQFTRRFSFGMDRRWKSAVLTQAIAALPAGGQAVDVACGTGDLAYAMAAARPGATVTGIDLSARMIDEAERRPERPQCPNVSFAVGDLMQLQLPDASADVVTAGYALRNVPDWQGGLRELARVLRPGGCLLTLDFYRPSLAPWRALYLGYLRAAGDVVGWWWHGRPVVYGYIARSIAAFCSWQEFRAALNECGFSDVRVERYLGGGVAIHRATRNTR